MLELQGKQLQLLMQNIKDRIVNVPVQDNGLIPLEVPGMEAIISRDAQRAVAEVEKRLKIALYPKRKTDLPGSARKIYEEKSKFITSFLNPLAVNFPQWHHLDDEQKEIYPSQTDYESGTLPWDYWTNAQKRYFETQVKFAPTKVGDSETLDGKGRNFIKLHERNIVKVHQVALRVRSPNDTMSFRGRTYSDRELIVYKEQGAIQLMPAMARVEAMRDGSAFLATQSTSYGLTIPRIPQILVIDYTFGFEEIPMDLMDAVAMTAAMKVFESVNVGYTKGLLGFSVQGFNAQFGKGMYAETMARYEDRADRIFANHSYASITGY